MQSGIDTDILRRSKSPGMGGQSDTASAVSGVVSSELFENVNYTEEDYSEDLLPEAAAEMGQGTYFILSNFTCLNAFKEYYCVWESY